MGRGHSSTSVKMSHLSGNSMWPLIKFVFACMYMWMDVCVRESVRECVGGSGGHGNVVRRSIGRQSSYNQWYSPLACSI